MSNPSSNKRVALITGANKGIGYEIAHQLGTEHGMTVFVGARDVAHGQAAAEKLAARGVDARAVQLDVTDPANVEAVARQIERDFGGRLDVLVNNAGVSLEYAPPSQTDLEKYQATHLTNTFGPRRPAAPTGTCALNKAAASSLRPAPSMHWPGRFA